MHLVYRFIKTNIPPLSYRVCQPALFILKHRSDKYQVYEKKGAQLANLKITEEHRMPDEGEFILPW
jgi:hypothetical protein